jgi:VWFA-related protein
LLILSDGTGSHGRYSENDLMHAAIEANVQVYSIVIDNGSASTNTIPYRPSMISKPWDQPKTHAGSEMLDKLADQTGGLHFHVRSGPDANDAAIKIGQALRNEYVIAYRPPDSGIPGKRHRIRVKSDVSNVSIHAGESYYSR